MILIQLNQNQYFLKNRLKKKTNPRNYHKKVHQKQIELREMMKLIKFRVQI